MSSLEMKIVMVTTMDTNAIYTNISREDITPDNIPCF